MTPKKIKKIEELQAQINAAINEEFNEIEKLKARLDVKIAEENYTFVALWRTKVRHLGGSYSGFMGRLLGYGGTLTPEIRKILDEYLESEPVAPEPEKF